MKFFGNKWDEVLEDEFKRPYFQELLQKVDDEYATRTIYPPQHKIFSALKLCDYDHVKVVILGQDPYHGAGQAHGLAFSVMPPTPPPPSLVNIFKELHDDLGVTAPNHGCLISWAKQGVLLLNTTLTVRETFTDAVIQKINNLDKPVVFLLWGANAKSKMKFIDQNKHLVLCSVHPSPLSAYNGFFGCRHFSKANEFLKQHGREPISWQIKDI